LGYNDDMSQFLAMSIASLLSSLSVTNYCSFDVVRILHELIYPFFFLFRDLDTRLLA
jgi:hypothetical protein